MKKFQQLLVLLLVSFSLSSFASATMAEDFILLDVRTHSEFQESHVSGAINIDVLKSDFKQEVIKLDKIRLIKVYCRSGARSGKAIEIMKTLGFQNMENLGSLQEAAKKLNRPCEGKKPCP